MYEPKEGYVMTEFELAQKAKSAAENSYSPYSHFKVGAALLCADGTVFTGCNVENSSFGATNCAERTAVFSAVASGRREFAMLAVAGRSGEDFTEFTAPCGICRQVLGEFCGEDFKIILTKNDEIKIMTLNDFLPNPFDNSFCL